MKHAGYSKIVYVCVYVCVFVLIGCRNDSVCHEDREIGWVCELRRAYLDDNNQRQVANSVDSLTVVGIGQAEPLYNNSKKIGRIVLPMHTQKDSTLFTLLYHNVLDTLCIHHTNQQKFISMECGCIVEHDMTKVRTTNHWISRIEVLTDTMRTAGQTNMNIWIELE